VSISHKMQVYGQHLILVKATKVIQSRTVSYFLFIFCSLINIDTDSSRCIRLLSL